MITLSSEEQMELLEREDITVHASPYTYLAYVDKTVNSTTAEVIKLYYYSLRHFPY